MLWRHGDVLIAAVTAIPAQAKPHPSTVLAYGEVTGHSHRIETPESAELWEINGHLYMTILATTRVIHEEHKPITLVPGTYRVWMQREYTPQAIVTVRD
jgi:hypothetical protein